LLIKFLQNNIIYLDWQKMPEVSRFFVASLNLVFVLGTVLFDLILNNY